MDTALLPSTPMPNDPLPEVPDSVPEPLSACTLTSEQPSPSESSLPSERQQQPAFASTGKIPVQEDPGQGRMLTPMNEDPTSKVSTTNLICGMF